VELRRSGAIEIDSCVMAITSATPTSVLKLPCFTTWHRRREVIMRSLSKSLLLKAGIVAVVICVGGTALFAWQGHGLPSKIESKLAIVAGGMSTFIRDIHHSDHAKRLPVQIIEGRD
jgi:hypothetical protein